MMFLDDFEKDFMESMTMQKQNDFTKQILSSLPADIKQRANVLTFKKGEYLVRMQEPVKSVHIVIEGRFHVINEFESGRSYEPLATYESDFIGVVEYFTKTKDYFANVKAMEESKVIELPLDDFKIWTDQSLSATHLVIDSVCRNFKLTMEHSGEEMVLNSMYIFVRYLLRSATKHTKGYILDEGREITSQRTGINIRTMYRHINKLKKLGLVTIEKRRIHFDETQKDNLLDYYESLRN